MDGHNLRSVFYRWTVYVSVSDITTAKEYQKPCEMILAPYQGDVVTKGIHCHSCLAHEWNLFLDLNESCRNLRCALR